MAVFDASFVNPKTRKSSTDYGFLVDGLSIYESQLASDGNLSPGDYELLNSKARELYTHPGLTPEQRSNVAVKMANYKEAKAVTSLKRGNDIGELNNNVKDEMATIGLQFANDPAKFLQAKSALLSVKIDRLSRSIDQLEGSGADASAHYNELNAAMNEYSENEQALNDVKSYDGSGNTKSDFAAYIVTNSKGEITDLKIDHQGGQSGYLQTNGVYGGLPVYGKLNRSVNGQSTFKLGNQTFTQSQEIVTGPDGVTQQKLLVAGGAGSSGIRVNGGNVNIDTTKVKTQSYVPDGGWLEGSNGFLYQKKEDGSGYKKYVNTDQAKLGLAPGDVIKMPKSFEQNILSDVTETIDGSIPPPTSPQLAPGIFETNNGLPTGKLGIESGAAATTPATATPAGAPAQQPTVRTPAAATGYAAAPTTQAKGFFANLFGR